MARSAEDFDTLPVLDPALEELGWNALTRNDITPNRFVLTKEGFIEVRTSDSNALIFKEISEVDRNAARFTWRWRVDEAPPPTDITVKGGDDRAVSVYLGFETPPNAKPGFFKKIRNSLVEAIVGVPITGYSLTYTWGGKSSIGTMFNNPHLPDSSYVFVRQNSESPLSEWLSEEVDIAADFESAFGLAATSLRFIAIAGDSEDTRVETIARVTDLKLVD